MSKKQMVRAGLIVAVGAVAGLASAEGTTVIGDMTTAATALITAAVTAVSSLCVAGFAIAGAMWGARKIKAGIRAA